MVTTTIMTNLYHNGHNDNYDNFLQLISQSQPNTVNMYLYHNSHVNYDKFISQSSLILATGRIPYTNYSTQDVPQNSPCVHNGQ